MIKLLVPFLFVLSLVSTLIPPKAEPASYLPIPNLITGDEVVHISTLMTGKDSIQMGAMGSGSVISSDASGSIVLTNRHVCLIGPHEFIMRALDPSLTFTKTVKTFDGKTYIASILKVSDKTDLCLMHVDGLTNWKTLKLAKKAPLRNDSVFSSGYPAGIWTGKAPVFSGSVVSNIKLNEWISQIVTIPIVGGQSGSPVMNKKGELVGVVWGKFRAVDSMGLIVPWDDLRDFLK